jgi:ribonuclease Y
LTRQIADYSKKTEILERKQQELDTATKKVEMLKKFLTILPKKLKQNW